MANISIGSVMILELAGSNRFLFSDNHTHYLTIVSYIQFQENPIALVSSILFSAEARLACLSLQSHHCGDPYWRFVGSDLVCIKVLG